MNARRRLVLQARDGHWLAAIGFLLIVCLFGCHTQTGNGDPVPQPAHTTHVTHRPTAPAVNPTHQAAPAVPKDATGYCADGTYTTAHSDAGKAEQCADHGGVPSDG